MRLNVDPGPSFWAAVETADGKYAQKLFNDLFEDYSNALRPVEDTDKVLNVTLQITLSQIKDMVSNIKWWLFETVLRLKRTTLSKEVSYLEFERKWEQTATCTCWWGKGIPRKEAFYKSNFTKCYLILTVNSNNLDHLNRDGVTYHMIPLLWNVRNRQNPGDRKQNSGCQRPWEERGNSGWWLDGHKADKNVLELDNGDGCTVDTANHWTVRLNTAKGWVSCFTNFIPVLKKKGGVLRWHIFFVLICV